MANNVNVVNRGFEYICQYLNGAVPTSTVYPQPKYIGWGTANGSNAASVILPALGPSNTIGTGQWSDIAPYSEAAESRTAGTLSVINNSVGSGTVGYQVVGTITSLTGQSIGESFLAMASAKPSAFTLSGTQGATTTTSLTVTTSGGTANGYYQMDNEVILVNSTSASNVWNISRAQNGSTANIGKTGDVLTNGNPPGYGSSDPNNADLFAHAGFVALSLNTNDSIQFTWQVNVTS